MDQTWLVGEGLVEPVEVDRAAGDEGRLDGRPDDVLGEEIHLVVEPPGVDAAVYQIPSAKAAAAAPRRYWKAVRYEQYRYLKGSWKVADVRDEVERSNLCGQLVRVLNQPRVQRDPAGPSWSTTTST